MTENSINNPLDIISNTHKRMDEIEAELTPLRGRVFRLEKEWEKCGREASEQFRKLMQSDNG